MIGIVFCILTLAVNLNAEKILIMQPFSSKSHKYTIAPVAIELAKRGHNITWLVAENNDENLPETIKELAVPILSKYYSRFQELSADLMRTGFRPYIFKSYFSLHSDMCNTLFSLGLLQNWIANQQKFDLIIIDSALNECLLPLWNNLAKSSILLNTATMTPLVAITFQVPMPPSYIPLQTETYTQRMTFWQRIDNSVRWLFSRYIIHVGHQSIHEHIVKPYFPDTRPFHETMYNVSLVLVNADPVVNSPRPTLPTVINIGGIHCRPSKRLPEGSLKDFVDGSGKEGFIIVSFGTIFNGDMTAKKILNIFITAFARIKQRVVWKFESPLANLSENVKLVNWLPQQDLLGHPKARACLNHGGLLTVQEAVYHAVPLITFLLVPTDPPAITAYTDELGINIALSLDSLSVDGLVAAINKVCNDQTIKQNVEKYSRIFRDQPESPLDKAVFWVEYVLRHDGALHLRGPEKHLNFFQYFLLDVISVGLIVAIVVASSCWFTVKRIFNLFFRGYNRLFGISVKVKIQ